MLAWTQNNWGTIIVALIVIAAITAVIVKIIKEKKSGILSIGSGCRGCPNSAYCHRKSYNGCAQNPNRKKPD